MAWENVQYENGKYKTSSGGGGGGSVTDVEVDGVSVVNQQGVAEIPAITAVEANPQGSASTDLTKIKIGATNYNIPSGGGSGHNYSTTEQVVGTWIDGKPLYEKVLTASNVNINNNYELAIGESNIEICFIKDGYFVDYRTGSASYGMVGQLPFFQSNSRPLNGDGFDMYWTKNSPTVLKTRVTDQFSADANRTLIVIVQYTKTTD